MRGEGPEIESWPTTSAGRCQRANSRRYAGDLHKDLGGLTACPLRKSLDRHPSYIFAAYMAGT